ncbi:hypothetical protein CWS43_13195 [Rahnella sp. AA]|nr:hypothetical protein CWS43_13195 [Rahnella sp. AA]
MSDSIYPSFFALLVRWLRLLTLITDWSQLIGLVRLPPSRNANYLDISELKAQLLPRSNNDIRCA